MLMDLRADPFERARRDSELYYKWMVDRVFLLVPAQAYVGQFLASFKEFPQRQKVGSFTIDQVMQQLQASPSQ